MKLTWYSKLKGLILVCLLVIAALMLRAIGVDEYCFTYIVKYRQIFAQFTGQQYLLSVAVYMGLFAIAIASSLPLSVPFTLLGTFLFGLFPGLLYVNIAGTIGATGAFLIARYLMKEWAEKTYLVAFEKFNSELAAYGPLYLLVLHLFPVTPFFVLNIIAGLTNLSLWTFIWTTSIGMIPTSCVYGIIGLKLATIGCLKDILSPEIIIAFITLKIIALLGFLYFRFRDKLMI